MIVTKETYGKIRFNRTFLYEYFIAAGGARVPEQQFAILFGVWLNKIGGNPQESTRKIVSFLDKKFGHK